jgi:hypothetical protein
MSTIYRVVLTNASGLLVFRSGPFDTRHEAQLYANDVARTNRGLTVTITEE